MLWCKTNYTVLPEISFEWPVAEKYDVKSLPKLVVIDGKGKIYYIHDGYAPSDENKLKIILNKLIDVEK